VQILRYRSFATSHGGGNPAGVVLDSSGLSADQMLTVAADVGYSETAFLTPISEREYQIRYFSPEAEVDFCGHATVAASIAIAETVSGVGDLLLHTKVGPIEVSVHDSDAGLTATLTSVVPKTAELRKLPELLGLLDWDESDLDPNLPAGLAFAGLWHPIVWARTRERLAELDYDFTGLKELMRSQGWGTVSLLFRESGSLIHSRNAFAVGGVVEDPATGAAAAALGGYLRSHDRLPADGRFSVRQGEDMGQPCLLEVDASGLGGVQVGGLATSI